MRQPQQRLQGANQGAARATLLRCVALVDLHLGDFQVPVAELVPDQVVNGVGHQVEPVVGKTLRHGGFDALQARDDPAVGLAEFQIAAGQAGLAGVLLQAAVLPFAIHQREAGGVPELVAEIAVALAALAVEIDAAAERSQRGKGQAQRVRAVSGYAVRELFLGLAPHPGRGLWFAQPGTALVQQSGQGDAVDQIHRVEHIAFAFAHFLALRVEHQAVDVDLLERHATGEVGRHHDHARNPEEDDVVAGHQHARWQVEIVVAQARRAGGGLRRFCSLRPAHGGEGYQRRRVPGVEHVRVAPKLPPGGLFLRLRLAARDVNATVFVVPGRNLMTPPELAADAPVLQVVHPLVVGVDPVFRHERHRARGHRLHRFFRNRAAAVVVGVAYRGQGDEPLIGQHRLDDLAGACAARHHQSVRLGMHQQAGCPQVVQHRLPGDEAVQAAVFFWRAVVDAGVQPQHAHDRQAVALANSMVVGVVRRRDLDHTGAEVTRHISVGNHGNAAFTQGQDDVLANQVQVALILRMHHQRHVAQHGLRPGGGHRQAARTVGQRVGNVPEKTVFFDALDFQIGHGALQHRVPVDQPLAPVDQALLVESHKGFGHHLGQLVVHGEVFAAPVDAVAQAAHLPRNGVTAFFLPLPDFGDEVLAAQFVAADALFL